MTIAIASYQRRAPLLRLLRALDDQVVASPDARARPRRSSSCSTAPRTARRGGRRRDDGGCRCTVRWQPNRGALLQARNVGLGAAGGIVWFLDDDVVPSPGLLARHRRGPRRGRSHRRRRSVRDPTGHRGSGGGPRVVGRVPRPLDPVTTSTATSCSRRRTPAARRRCSAMSVGSTRLHGLRPRGLRARRAAARRRVRLTFDADAIAWHPEIEAARSTSSETRGIGLNVARITQLHPETLDLLFPVGRPRRRDAPVALLRVRRPATLMAVSRRCRSRQPALRWHAGLASAREHLARSAPGRRCGRGGRRGAARPAARSASERRERRSARLVRAARSSRQPATMPTNNDTTISR